MTGAVAIFVKTPGLSPVKTRLALGLGRERAEAWHCRSASTVAGVVREALQEADVCLYWAVAEAAGMDAGLWQDYPRELQPSGTLGERMAGIHEELTRRHGWCLLLGADTPQIQGETLVRAAGWLNRPEPAQVLGPATDGGFWTWGANRIPDPARWTEVNYSRPDTADRFRRVMSENGAWLELEPRTDLDTAGDLPGVLDELQSLRRPTRKQRALTNWLAALHPTLAGYSHEPRPRHRT